MNTRTSITAVFFLCLLFTIPCALTSAADAPANVAGTWTIAVSGETGSASQTIVLKQEGSKITVSFKGPRQSGDLEGTVDGNKIAFHVKTPVPLNYVGTVDGDTMKGTLSAHGKSGDWTATRTK
jgi:hypothetical protein